MKNRFLFASIIVLFSQTFTFAQGRYYTDIKDSIYIDSVLKEELNNPRNIIIAKYDTASNVIYKYPSKSSEAAGYIEYVTYSAKIIIGKGKYETIGNRSGFWYRIYSDDFMGKLTGWVFEPDMLLLKPDSASDKGKFDGTYFMFIASPCINFFTIRTNNEQGTIAKNYYAFISNDDKVDFMSCYAFPTPLLNSGITYPNFFHTETPD